MKNMKEKRVLVITPHPDDAESGAGGTIAKWSHLGANIVLVVCTNGNKGTSDRSVSSEELAQTRRKEQLESAKLLGLTNVVFLDHPDQGVTNGSLIYSLLTLYILYGSMMCLLTIRP